MTAIVAALASMVTLSLARWYWGYIVEGRFYHHGQVMFPVNELK
jgi:hypothetical protein